MKKFILVSNEVITNCLDYIAALQLKPVMTVEIKKFVKQRTLDQNAYYWRLLTELGMYLGYSKDEMHDICRHKFLGYDEKMIKGEIYRTLKHTPNLETPEMAIYTQQIEAWAVADLGFVLMARPC